MNHGARILEWLDENTCLYQTKEYFEPEQLRELDHLIPDRDDVRYEVISVIKDDEKSTEEWPHTYRVAIKPKPKNHGSTLMTMGVG